MAGMGFMQHMINSMKMNRAHTNSAIRNRLINRGDGSTSSKRKFKLNLLTEQEKFEVIKRYERMAFVRKKRNRKAFISIVLIITLITTPLFYLLYTWLH